MYDGNMRFTPILEMDEFTGCCGYAFDADSDPEYEECPDVNGGYNCSHPDQEWQEECSNGKKIGCCDCGSCPLGFQASYRDLLEAGIIDKESADEAEDLDDLYEHTEYIVVTDPEAVAALKERKEAE